MQSRPIHYDQVCVFEEAAILESHGIEVQSPGGQSNSDEVDGSDFPDQVSRPPQTPRIVSPWQRKLRPQTEDFTLPWDFVLVYKMSHLAASRFEQ